MDVSKENRNRKLQLIELEILKEVVKVCNQYNIEYFIDSGTALGAFRHSGFIPWDDDIDIGMTRANYDRFLKIAPKEINSEIFIQNRKTDKKSPFYSTRARKNNTTHMEWDKRNMKIHHGVYIDIFPYDSIPDNENKRLKFQKRCKRIIKIYKIRSIPDRYKKPEKNIKWWSLAIIRRLLHYTLVPIPISWGERYVEKNFRKYNNKQTQHITCLSYGGIHSFKKDDIFPVREIVFEGNVYFAPNNMDNYLKELYGDYMTLPPEKERIGHEPYKLAF